MQHGQRVRCRTNAILFINTIRGARVRMCARMIMYVYTYTLDTLGLLLLLSNYL